MHQTAKNEWSYALALLVLVSASFLALRLFGRAFLAVDFEISVIHVGTVVCLLVYVMMRFRSLVST